MPSPGSCCRSTASNKTTRRPRHESTEFDRRQTSELTAETVREVLLTVWPTKYLAQAAPPRRTPPATRLVANHNRACNSPAAQLRAAQEHQNASAQVHRALLDEEALKPRVSACRSRTSPAVFHPCSIQTAVQIVVLQTLEESDAARFSRLCDHWRDKDAAS